MRRPHVLVALVALVGVASMAVAVPAVAAPRDQAIATFDRAVELAREGRLAESVLTYREARLLFERAEPLRPRDLALADEGLAAALLVHGDLVEARRLAQRLLDQRQQGATDRSPALARAQRLMGRVEEASGHADAALEHYRSARAIRRRIHGNHHPSVLGLLHDEGRVLTQQGRLDEAEIMALQAASLAATQTEAQDPLLFESILVLAENAWRRDDLAEAERYYRRALDDGDAALGRLDRRWVDALRGLARCRIAAGDLDEAATLLTRAASIYDDAWWLAGAGDARAMFQTSPHADRAVVEILRGNDEAAWTAAEAHQSRLLSLDLALQRLEPEFRSRIDETRRRLFDADLALRQARREGSAAETLNTREHWLDAATQWESLMEQAPRQGFEQLQVTSARVRQSLPDDAALLRWIDLEVRPDAWFTYLGWTAPDRPLRWVRLPDADRSAGDMSRSPRERTTPAVDLADLQRAWLGGEESRLSDYSRWYVIPSGESVNLPLEALPAAQARVVQATPSASWLVHAETRRLVEPNAPALVVADPGPGQVEVQFASQTAEVLRSALAGNAAARRELAPLPGARREARAVADALPAARIYAGREATEAQLGLVFAGGSSREYAVLHFATHALVDDYVPARSALVLAPPETDDVPPDRDGLLTVEEIRQRWSLHADLVVLSACETALGPRAGGEGHLGFAQSLLAGGARQLVLSRWKVDDAATSLFMEHFYRSLGIQLEFGLVLDPAAALRDARVALRSFENAAGRRPYRDPYYWAAFTCVGGR